METVRNRTDPDYAVPSGWIIEEQLDVQGFAHRVCPAMGRFGEAPQRKNRWEGTYRTEDWLQFNMVLSADAGIGLGIEQDRAALGVWFERTLGGMTQDLSGSVSAELWKFPPDPAINRRSDLNFPSIPQRTFPDSCHAPPGLQQLPLVSPITLHVGIELCPPELLASRRRGRVRATGVTVPETAMDQADSAVARKNQIRFAGKAIVVQSIPEASSVQGATQDDFRTCVLAPNPRHHAGPCFPIYYVRHGMVPFQGLYRVFPSQV